MPGNRVIALPLLAILLVLVASPPTEAKADYPPISLTASLLQSPKPPAGLAPSLFQLWQTWTSDPWAAQFRAHAQGLHLHGELVLVEIEALPGQGEQAKAAVIKVGGEVQIRSGDHIQALVPLRAIMDLLNQGTIARLQPPARLAPNRVLTEGIALIDASSWHSRGFTGSNVKIGIIDSFADWETLKGIELPQNTIFRDFTTPRPPSVCDDPLSRRHGVAVAEIVHDVAPAAQLYFAQVNTEVEFAKAVQWLAEQGVQVINLSAGFIASPPAGARLNGYRDLVGESVDWAAQQGILWVNSAGNNARSHWMGTFSDADADGWLDFQPGTYINAAYLPGGVGCVAVTLFWDDPWGGSCNDYDLYAAYFDPFGEIQLVTSNAPQNCSASSIPLEVLDLSEPVPSLNNTLYIAIKKSPTAQPRRLGLTIWGGRLEFFRPEGSLVAPADRATALAVGAVRVTNPIQLEPFSSQGPSWDGRLKPDLVAPDGVSTVTYGVHGFYGTSASAPHVAGAAALVLQAHPDWTAQQVRQFLEGRAIDLGPLGKDNSFGAGRLNLGEPPRQSPPLSLIWGDVDCDDSLTAVDALKLLRHVVGLPNSPWVPQCPLLGQRVLGLTLLWGDIDCSSDVSAVDALQILRYVAGLPTGTPTSCPVLGQEVQIQPP